MFRFEAFLKHLADIQRASTTVKEYRHAFRLLEQHVTGLGITDDRAVMREHIDTLLEEVRKRTYDDYAVLVGARFAAYFRFLVERGQVLASPMEGWKARRADATHHPILRADAVAQMLDALNAADPITVRTAAILELAYSSALRPREVRSLKLRDIDQERGVLFIEQSKGRKDRIVPVGRRALAKVDRYVTEVRPHYAKGVDNQHVFVSHTLGGKLSMKGLRWAIRTALGRAGFGPIRPASLRGSAATALLEAGMNTAHIQRLLGHARINTTLVYLRVNERELRARLAERHPRGKWRIRPRNRHHAGRTS